MFQKFHYFAYRARKAKQLYDRNHSTKCNCFSGAFSQLRKIYLHSIMTWNFPFQIAFIFCNRTKSILPFYFDWDFFPANILVLFLSNMKSAFVQQCLSAAVWHLYNAIVQYKIYFAIISGADNNRNAQFRRAKWNEKRRKWDISSAIEFDITTP